MTWKISWTWDEHQQVGRELHHIHRGYRSMLVWIGNTYPLRVHRWLAPGDGQLSRLRSTLDARLWRQFPARDFIELATTYYPGVETPSEMPGYAWHACLASQWLAQWAEACRAIETRMFHAYPAPIGDRLTKIIVRLEDGAALLPGWLRAPKRRARARSRV